jgi:transcriptional regulator with XRE-family HTH domain
MKHENADVKTTGSLNERIGRLIRERRKELCLTQKDLAERLNVTAQQIQKYERGLNVLSLHRLLAINEALVVPPSYFFVRIADRSEQKLNEENEIFSEKPAQSLLSVQDIDDFLRNFCSLKIETQRYVVALVGDLAEVAKHNGNANAETEADSELKQQPQAPQQSQAPQQPQQQTVGESECPEVS